MEVLLALSLTVALIGLLLGGVVSFTRHRAADAALEAVNVTAKSLEAQLQRDLAVLSRIGTFTQAGDCPQLVTVAGGALRTSLSLLDARDGGRFTVTYTFDGAARRLTRSAPVAAPEGGARVFDGVVSFQVGCLQGGVVTASAVVRERVDGAAAAVGQQVEVRVASEVRMR